MINTLYIANNLTILKSLPNQSIHGICTDPPYLTNNTKLTYSDRMDEAQWINLMRERLIECRRVLKPTGTLIINIDERMHIELATICNDIFGKKNKICTFIWKKRSSAANQARISLTPFPGCIEVRPMNGDPMKEINMKYIFKNYCITNTITNMSYTGYTEKSLKDRWKKHIQSMKDGSDYYLHNAMRKYGIENFIIQEIECYATKEEALEQEDFWIQYLGTMAPNGYNMTKGGGCPPSQSNYAESHIGHEVKESVRKKLSGKEHIGVRKTPAGKFAARITLGNKEIYVGTFATEKEASEARTEIYEEYQKKVKKTAGCWRAIPSTCQKLIDADMLVVKNGKIYQKQYAHFQFNRKTGQLEPTVRTISPRTIILEPSNLQSNKEIKAIFGESKFTYAKPLDLIKKLIKLISNEGDTILDIFSGSGTTGQAAYELKRNFILCQLDEGNIPALLQERLDKTIGKENYKVK